MKEVPSTFKDWTDTILCDEHKSEYSTILCGKAVTADDWLSVYLRSGPSSGCENVVNETACQRLRELVITAAAWQKIFEGRGRSTISDPIGLFALGEMAKHVSTINECVFVYDHATLDATTRTAMAGKLQGLDGSFGDWQQLFDRKKNLAPFETIAMQKMVERATTIKEWQYVYEHSSLQPERNRRALKELTKLATAEPATV